MSFLFNAYMSGLDDALIANISTDSKRTDLQVSGLTVEQFTLVHNLDARTEKITLANVTKATSFLPSSNPNGIMKYETYLLCEYILSCWLHNAITLVGVPTNLISCLVFYKQGLRDRMNLCLFCLALVDLLFVALFYTIGTYCIVGYFRPDIQDWWKWSVRCYVTGVYRAFLFSSGCLTMVIAVERCVCVLYPMKAENLIQTRTMARIILGIVFTMHLLCLVYPLKLSVASVPRANSNQVDYKLGVTKLYLQNQYVFDIVENTIIMTVIPFTTYIVVVLATAVTVVQLNRALAWRQMWGSSVSSSTARQTLLVKMLVAVSCIYILLTSPNIALGITRSVVAEFAVDRSYAYLFLATHGVYLEMCMLNSSISFFVYFTLSSRFRRTLYNMISAHTTNKSMRSNLVKVLKRRLYKPQFKKKKKKRTLSENMKLQVYNCIIRIFLQYPMLCIKTARQ
ncbi:probable G-protein coupled receptor 32 [Pomacea canaliculata]|uniref:probable G-protein coupled receptor 32 n=1 Tax=Pomacea canaliculata TaxID=400727 RepID=UPI000D739596|nr:probable G-protein coupled receptor 32 [Pomacea canaliculata]